MSKNNTQLVKYNINSPSQAKQMANFLKEYIVKNNLYVDIMGKNYVMVEGWQFAGMLVGLTPIVTEVKELKPNKWMARVEIINKDRDVVSVGVAICSKEEKKKSTFDEYAILSMAQTRAIGKAFRNKMGFVMKLAGYEATPAEEMKNGMIKTTNNVKKNTSVEPEGTKVGKLKEMLKGNTDKDKLADLKKRTGIANNDFNITDKHAGILIASLLNIETK